MGNSSGNTETSKQRAQAMYAAATAGDFAGALNCMDDDIVVIEPPYLPFGGTYRGKQEFQSLLGRISEYADLSGSKILYTVADGDIAMVALQIKDRKTGKLLQLLEQSTVRNDKIVEIKVFYFDAGSMIEAGLKAETVR